MERDHEVLERQVRSILRRLSIRIYRKSRRQLWNLSYDDLFRLSVWLEVHVEGRGGVELPRDIVLLSEYGVQTLALLPIISDGNASVWLDSSGKCHREDGPACVTSAGSEVWYFHGEFHREGGPAVVYPDGSEYWYRHGKRHRVGGPAVEYPDGSESWWLNGKRHREGGPAVEYSDGTEIWYLDGKCIDHRVEGFEGLWVQLVNEYRVKEVLKW